jgi:hypothetical protein
MRVSVALGLGSEAGLRVWNLAASVLTVPVVCMVGSRCGLKGPYLVALSALATTSPVLDRYACQARGYGLAILLGAASLSIHLECCFRPSRVKLAALWGTNVLLILANVFTIPLIAGEVAHLVAESLISQSALRRRGHPYYSTHLLALTLSLIAGLAIHTFLLPSLLLNSIVFASKTRLTVPMSLRVLSAPLVPSGSVAVGGLFLTVLLGDWRRPKWSDAERTSSLALFAVLACGFFFALASHVFELRALAYLHAPAILLLVSGISGLIRLRGGKALKALTVALTSIACLIGAYAAIERPPIQDYRALIRKAKARTGARPLWTSGFAAEGIEYYASIPTPGAAPPGPTVYIGLFESDPTDPILAAVKRECRPVERVRSEVPMGIYECP